MISDSTKQCNLSSIMLVIQLWAGWKKSHSTWLMESWAVKAGGALRDRIIGYIIIIWYKSFVSGCCMYTSVVWVNIFPSGANSVLKKKLSMKEKNNPLWLIRNESGLTEYTHVGVRASDSPQSAKQSTALAFSRTWTSRSNDALSKYEYSAYGVLATILSVSYI